MSNPGPPGEDERPLAGPDIGMGLPESGTQHATSTDFALPLDRPTQPPAAPEPPLPAEPYQAAGGASTPADLSTPNPPAAGPLVGGTPPGDALATSTSSIPDAYEPTAGTSAGAGGLLEKVKAFADQRPEAFLAAALVAGWVAGKLLGSSDDESED